MLLTQLHLTVTLLLVGGSSKDELGISYQGRRPRNWKTKMKLMTPSSFRSENLEREQLFESVRQGAVGVSQDVAFVDPVFIGLRTPVKAAMLELSRLKLQVVHRQGT
jgi:hypothetical protein